MKLSLAIVLIPATLLAQTPDRRVGLRAGWFDAGTAAWNMHLVSNSPPSPRLMDRNRPGAFDFLNTDLGFKDHFVFEGNFSGYQVWDVADPSHPRLETAWVCPGSQSDVSVFRNLAFISGEATNGRVDCGTQGVPDSVSHERLRGLRIYDITDPSHPRHIIDVQTCRGSHTHTVVNSPHDSANVYVYISGTAPVRSSTELSGCSGLSPDQDPNTALFRIEVIRVPLAHPEQATLVSSARIFDNLNAPARHGETLPDSLAHMAGVDSARRRGAFIYDRNGAATVVGDTLADSLLHNQVVLRGGSGAPTAADSAALRASLQGIMASRFVPEYRRADGTRLGPTQCHDITVYPALDRAAGACAGYGLLLDISDPAHPRRIGAAADSNFSFWHSATFNNDGTRILFSDEWGGGLQPRCRSTDKPEWGADAIFTVSHDSMVFQGYYKLPVAQSAVENCVAHNGSLIPIPGRDVMAQGWYQGGVSVFDWSNPAHPVEIAYFDRGPMDSTKLVNGGEWCAYWYNGLIYSSELSRGLDIFALEPSAWLTQHEIDAAKLVRLGYLNVQDQQKITWPVAFVVAQAYVDQLARSRGLSAARVTAVRSALARAEHASGSAKQAALNQLASQLERDAAGSSDAAKVRMLQDEVRQLAGS